MKKNVLLVFFSFLIVLPSLAQDRILADFEDEVLNVTISKGDMDTVYIVENPSKTGINTSDNVLRVDKPRTEAGWYFAYVTFAPQLDLIAHPVFSWKVLSSKAVTFTARFDNDIRWEQQMFSNEFKNNAETWGVEAGEVDTWVEFDVDLSKYPFNRFVSISLGISLNDTTPGTFYLDDIKFNGRESAVTSETVVPIWYEPCGSFRWVGSWAGGGPADEFVYYASYKATMSHSDTLGIDNGWNWNADYTDDLPSDTIAGSSSGPYFYLQDGTRHESLSFNDINVKGIDSLILEFDMAWVNTGTDVTTLEPGLEMKTDDGDWTAVTTATGLPDSDSAWTKVTASLDKITADDVSIRFSNQTGDTALLLIDELMLKGTQTLVTGITVSSEVDSIAKGAPLPMTSTVSPADARPNVGWAVIGGTAKATISTTGELKADTLLGTVIVQATALDGIGTTGQDTIVIADITVLVDTIIVTADNDSIFANEGPAAIYLQMSATAEPAWATNQSVDWSVDDQAIATINTAGVLTAVSNGEVIVTATAKDGSGAYGEMKITVVGVGIEDITNNRFIVYPNPAEDVLFISNARQITNVDVYTILGQKVMEIWNTSDMISVNTSGLNRGVYILRLATDEGVYTTKFVKK